MNVYFTDNVTKSELLLEPPWFIQIVSAPGSNFRGPVINQHVQYTSITKGIWSKLQMNETRE